MNSLAETVAAAGLPIDSCDFYDVDGNLQTSVPTPNVAREGLPAGIGAVVESFTTGATKAYELVVGADGCGSRVRQLRFPDAPAPAYSGQCIWRPASPAEANRPCPDSPAPTTTPA